MQITLGQLMGIMPNAGNRAVICLAPLNEAMNACFINNSKRSAAYLAECGHESGDLKYLAEIWGPEQVPVQKTYWRRDDLGNTRPEAVLLANKAGMFGVDIGKYYRGYGLIQVTGYDNQIKAARYYKIAPENMVNWLQTPKGACEASAYYWMTHGLNELADTEDYDSIPDEFDKISDIVNFGHPTKRLGDTNGWQDRLDHYERAKKILMWADVVSGVLK